MNNKQYKKLEKHYNRLVKNKTIKTLNECLVYKLAIDKAFSLQGVVKTLKDKYTPTFKEWKQDNYNHWGNNLFVKKQEGLRNIEQLQKIYKKEYNL